jgi:hypothetical protein
MASLGFVTKTMLFYLGVCVLGGLFEVWIEEGTSFFLTGMVLLLCLFFRNSGNPIAHETSMNWLFLVPDSPYKKVFYAMFAGSCGCALDLLPGILLATVIPGESSLTMLLWLVMLVAVDFMFSSVGMLLEAVCPANALDTVKSLIHMCLQMATLLVLAAVLGVGFLLGGETAALLVTMIFSLVVGGVIFIIYPSFLHSGR